MPQGGFFQKIFMIMYARVLSNGNLCLKFDL